MSAARTDTREKILALATTLIEEKGYTGFSYQDIADSLKIKKASIHYHFPAKEDLGVAVFDDFMEGIDDHLHKLEFERLSPSEKLAGYFRYHEETTLTCGQISCVGAMASEWNVLPEKMRERIEKFNKWHIGFISSILKEGIEKGEFKKVDSIEDQALFIIATTKGALLTARENRSVEIYHSIAKRLMESLKC